MYDRKYISGHMKLGHMTWTYETRATPEEIRMILQTADQSQSTHQSLRSLKKSSACSRPVIWKQTTWLAPASLDIDANIIMRFSSQLSSVLFSGIAILH